MTPEQEQRAADVAWLEMRAEAWGKAREDSGVGGASQAAARYRRIAAALTTDQEPVAWRIEGEEVNEEWSASFDYITDDAGVAEESATDGHKVTPLCPCLNARKDPSPPIAATQSQER